ncbi:MAG TPA: phosphatase PAP2 family protein [Ignavibacteriaceae bacterium]
MIRYYSAVIALLICVNTYCLPETPGGAGTDSSGNKSPSTIQVIEYDINKSLDDGLHILIAPAGFSGKDWAITGAVLGGTALSLTLDTGIRDVVSRNRTSTMDGVTKIGKFYGEVTPAIGLSAGLYAAGLLFNERSVSLTGRLLAESLLYAGTINVILKFVFSRSRPYTNNGNMDFGNYAFNNDYYSMPSGHTTVAFTVSTVLAERIQNVYATIGLYGLASLTAYQRIYSDNHWFSDTVLAAVIGTVIGRIVVKLNDSDPYQDHIPEISFFPINKGYCIGFNFNF